MDAYVSKVEGVTYIIHWLCEKCVLHPRISKRGCAETLVSDTAPYSLSRKYIAKYERLLPTYTVSVTIFLIL